MACLPPQPGRQDPERRDHNSIVVSMVRRWAELVCSPLPAEDAPMPFTSESQVSTLTCCTLMTSRPSCSVTVYQMVTSSPGKCSS